MQNPPEHSGDAEEGKKNFLITTYHPHDNTIPTIMRKNWDILGRNQATQNLDQQKLICWYRRPNKLRDIQCKVALHRIPKDDAVDPFYVTPPITPPPPPEIVTQTP